MPTFTTPGPIAATVEVAGAEVRVNATDRSDTVVVVEPLDPSSRKDVKVVENLKVAFAEGKLSVETKTAGDKKGSVAITIELPTGSSLVTYLAYSTVQARGTFGASEVHMASGQVRLDRVEALRASISSGDLSVARVAGDVDLSSGAGDIDIERADGSVTAETGGGSLRIGRMTNGRARLRNGSGNIEVGISEGSAASIDVDSERGAVHNFVATQGEPSASDPKVSVFARTRNGDITVQRAAG